MMACCRPNGSHEESCLVLRIVTVGGLKVGRSFVAALVSGGGKVLVKSKDTFAYLCIKQMPQMYAHVCNHPNLSFFSQLPSLFHLRL
jgi:hypothetical protein